MSATKAADADELTIYDQIGNRLEILAHIQNFVMLCRDTNIAYVNPAGLKMLGFDAVDELIDAEMEMITHADYLEVLSLGMDILSEEKMIPLKFMDCNGGILDVEMWVQKLDVIGPPVFMVEAKDVTEHLRAAKALRSREQRLEGIINTVADGIVTIDDKGTIQSFNAAAERMFKFSTEEIIGQNIRCLMPDPVIDGQQDQTGVEWQHILKPGAEIEGKRKNGQTFPMEIAIRELVQGDQLSFTGIVRDISVRKQAEEKIRHLAHHDALTGLPNRLILGDRLDEAIARAERAKSTLAFLFLDLNKFKPINDDYGHAIGDKILIAVADRLKADIRATDTVARIGGDEFVIILEDVQSEDQIRKIAQNVVSKIEQPIEIDANQHNLGISIGISIFPSQTKEPEQLIHYADLAMYAAKDSAEKSIQFYGIDG